MTYTRRIGRTVGSMAVVGLAAVAGLAASGGITGTPHAGATDFTGANGFDGKVNFASCRAINHGATPASADSRATRALPAVLGNQLVLASDSSAPLASNLPRSSRPGGSGIRHVSRTPAGGTVFVLHSQSGGSDTIEVDDPNGSRSLPAGGAAFQPAEAADGSLAWGVNGRLRLVRPSQSAVDIAGPAGATGVYSPLFSAPSGMVAVISTPAPGDAEAVGDNLYRLDANSKVWTVATKFASDSDAWTAIRTPILLADGSVDFVKIAGRGSATQAPTFELWSLTGNQASVVRQLPQDMYLAGQDSTGLVFNALNTKSGVWHLFRASGSSFVDIGCGATLADPVDEAPVPGQAATATQSTSDLPGALIVGDFATQQAAAQAKAALTNPAKWKVVTSATVPWALKTGVWGLLQVLPVGDDAMAELTSARAANPHYASMIFITSASATPSS